jgi:hypothetical protein
MAERKQSADYNNDRQAVRAKLIWISQGLCTSWIVANNRNIIAIKSRCIPKSVPKRDIVLLMHIMNSSK